jgi:hypothetical protein
LFCDRRIKIPYWLKFDQLETAESAYFKGFFRMN